MTNWSMEIHFTFHDVSINTTLCRLPTAVIHPLHSTMFLLIRVLRLPEIWSSEQPLHSTMFLLILRCPQEPAAVSVSLHSTMFLLIHDCLRENSLNIVALHSTMFLLIRIKKQMKSQVLHFTFHDVSINTGGRTWKAGFDSNFTFHDVSINTVRCR